MTRTVGDKAIKLAGKTYSDDRLEPFNRQKVRVLDRPLFARVQTLEGALICYLAKTEGVLYGNRS